MSTILETSNLIVNLGNQSILKGVNCKIPKGQISVIVGPSGSGKSTFLKTITRLIPSQGTVIFENKDVSILNIREYRKKAIYVGQTPVSFEGTVAENIEWPKRIWEEIEIDVDGLLNQVGLAMDFRSREANGLSVGQKQRLHLARSLALKPKLLLLDEPASALDAVSKEKFEDLIRSLKSGSSDMTIMMITHDLMQAQRIADYALLLVDGKITFAASKDVFFDKVEQMTEADILRKLMEEGG